ncbi:Fic family protein [Castellaniella daejeonensis]|jgi:cell filamentation protein|uniref:protein adenylyltransferase n=1 Tax=Castellaniella daejeonensis TaxID=659013 RepID=A0ABP3CVT0_9BURK|nr:Fic family protein [Castellaniella sp.]HET8703933.1 Fic family protein [Castellaniella sp.]
MTANRYQATGPQAECQPGSNDQVLRNRQGITDPDVMDDLETRLLLRLYERVMREQFPNRRLDVADLMGWHHQWLGNLYDWAGHPRSVNMSKDGFHFAAALQIPRLLDEFEQKYLHRYTPCHDLDRESLADAIAVCHVELILIHPFREGNGRVSRLLADVMAVQAGHGPLDYSRWDADKAAYFTAIQHGVSRDYESMRGLVSVALAGQSG